VCQLLAATSEMYIFIGLTLGADPPPVDSTISRLSSGQPPFPLARWRRGKEEDTFPSANAGPEGLLDCFPIKMEQFTSTGQTEA
jgi:hypothetical protein